MPVATMAGREVHVDEEGFLTAPTEWNEELAVQLARNIGIDELTEDHWKVIRFAREHQEKAGESPTLRQIQVGGGIPIKELFKLFPKKPAKKIAYVAGLQKPQGCV